MNELKDELIDDFKNLSEAAGVEIKKWENLSREQILEDMKTTTGLNGGYILIWIDELNDIYKNEVFGQFQIQTITGKKDNDTNLYEINHKSIKSKVFGPKKSRWL